MPNFLEILDDAIAIVTEAYPGSRLYEANGKSSMGVAFDENDIDIWRFLFLGPIEAKQATTVLLEYQAPSFRTPVLRSVPFRSDSVIEIGLKRAIKFKNNAGKTEPFQSVNLRLPFAPGDQEAFYIFGGVGTPFVFVGIRSGEVTTLDAESLTESN